MSTVFYSHPACRLHDMGHGHPECPQRLDAITDHLLASGLDVALDFREAPEALRSGVTVEEALRARGAVRLIVWLFMGESPQRDHWGKEKANEMSFPSFSPTVTVCVRVPSFSCQASIS